MRKLTPQARIAALMTESYLDGAAMAQQEQDLPMGGTEIEILNTDTDELEEPQEDEGFTEQELKLAKRFVELIGGTDRARYAIEKIDECDDCLDLIDDEEDQISSFADSMPDLPDLPTALQNNLNLSSLYNPSAINGL